MATDLSEVTEPQRKLVEDRKHAERELIRVRKLYVRARQAQEEATTALREVAPMARSQGGMSILDIAEVVGVTRQTVYSALGVKIRREPK